MDEMDGPVWPATGRTIDDVLDLCEITQEWRDAGDRLEARQRGEA